MILKSEYLERILCYTLVLEYIHFLFLMKLIFNHCKSSSLFTNLLIPYLQFMYNYITAQWPNLSLFNAIKFIEILHQTKIILHFCCQFFCLCFFNLGNSGWGFVSEGWTSPVSLDLIGTFIEVGLDGFDKLVQWSAISRINL